MSKKNTKIKKENSSIYIPDLPSYTRRIGAYILDLILFLTLLVGFAFATSAIVKYDDNLAAVSEKYIEHGVQYFDDEGNLVTEDDEIKANIAWDKFNDDPEATKLWDDMYKKTIAISTVSVFLALLILELIVPLILKNGRTVGKLVLHIALISKDDVKIKFKNLFIRFLFGKVVVNYLVPLFCVLLVYFGMHNILFYAIILIVLLWNVYTILGSKKHQSLPDSLGMCYPCDNDNQVFFDTVEELNAAKCKEEIIKNTRKTYY